MSFGRLRAFVSGVSRRESGFAWLRRAHKSARHWFAVRFSVSGVSLQGCAAVHLLLNDGIDDGNGSDIDDVAHRTLEVGEMDGLVQTHLNRTNDFALVHHRLHYLIGRVGRGQVGENQGVYVQTFQAREGILVVAQFLVEGEVVGPIQMGLNKPIHFTDFECSVRDIVNITAVAVIDAIVQEKKESGNKA